MKGVVRARGGGEGGESLRQPGKPEEEDFVVEILKLIQKEPPSGPGPVTTIQGNVENIVTGTQERNNNTTTTIYDDTVND